MQDGAQSTLNQRLSTVDDVSRQLGRGDLGAMRALLARILVAEPTMARMVEWADAYPDRWGSLLTAVGRLTGLAERHEHVHTVKRVEDMSDAEIAERLGQLSTRIGDADTVVHDARRLLPEIIEGSATPVIADPLA